MNEWLKLPKVLHVSYSSAGGAGLFASNLVKTLNEKNENYAQLISITNKSLREAPFQDLKTTFNSVLDEYLVRAQKFPTTYSFLRNSLNRNVYNQIKNHEGVLHFHWMNGVLNLNAISQLLDENAKIIWTCHDMEFFTGGCHHALDCENYQEGCIKCPAVKKIFIKVPQNQLVSKIRFSERYAGKIKIVLPSQWMQAKFTKSRIASFYETTVIENFIDKKYFLRRKIDTEQKENNKSLKVGFVSNWVENPVKNFHKLLEIVSEIDDPMDSKISILAVGESIESTRRQKKNNVIYFGKANSIDEMIKFYQEMDLLVSISYGESFGLAIAEAAALGIPTIAIGNTASAELIVDQVTGFICPDYESFKEKLKFVLRNRDILGFLGENAKNEAKTRWSPEINADKYLQVYSTLDK